MRARASRLQEALVLGFLTAGLLPRSARAEEASDVEKARALFREGRQLASDGRYEEACPKFQRSLELDVGIGTQFNLADCWEHTGHLKNARALFFEVADAAHQKAQDDRENVARERARALDEKLSKLGVEVKEVTDGLEVLVDGTAIDRANWASGERVDPGPHEIEARAPHKRPWSVRLDVPAVPTTVTIAVPKLDDVSEPSAKIVAEEKPTEEPLPEESREAGAKSTSVNRTAKILLLSGAGAGVLLAGTALAMYKMSNDDAKGVCPSSAGCSLDDVQRHEGFVDDAARARALGYLGLGITGAALIGFVVVSFTSAPNKEAPLGTKVSAGPMLGSGAYGASLTGKF